MRGKILTKLDNSSRKSRRPATQFNRNPKKSQLKRGEREREREREHRNIHMLRNCVFTVGSDGVEVVRDENERRNDGEKEQSEEQSPLPAT